MERIIDEPGSTMTDEERERIERSVRMGHDELAATIRVSEGFNEVKVRMFKDGKRYAFRCSPEQWESLVVPEHSVIPLVEFKII